MTVVMSVGAEGAYGSLSPGKLSIGCKSYVKIPAFTPAIRRSEMMDEVLDPCIVSVAQGWHARFPASILAQEFARPIRNVEWWIGNDVVGLEVRVQVACETVCRLLIEPKTEITLAAAMSFGKAAQIALTSRPSRKLDRKLGRHMARSFQPSDGRLSLG